MEQKREINKENVRLILATFWKFAKQYRSDLTISLVLIPINVVLISTIIPWLISRILDVLAKGGQQQAIVWYVVAIAVSGIVGLICNYFGYKRHFVHLAQSYASVMQQCFSTLMHRGEQFYADKFTGSLTKYAIDFPNSYSMLEMNMVTNLLPLLTRTLSGVFIVFIAGAPWLALFLLVMSIITFYSVFQSRVKRQAVRIQRRNAQTDINSHLADIITNNQTMRTFAQWDVEIDKNKKLVGKWKGLMDRDFYILNRLFNQLLRTSLFLQVSFIILLVILVQNGSLGLGIAIFCSVYLTRFATEVLALGPILNQTEMSLIDAVPMMQILNEDSEVLDDKNATKLKITDGSISFNNVCFAYQDNADQTILSNFTLDIRPGEKIGLVGASGGGKTTITKLLLRLYDIQSGSITIDGQDISQATQSSVRNVISYVPQEPLLFHRSISENISYGNMAGSHAAIISAAKKAHAHEFITQLPQQYKTTVGERGVKLSGGQRQRVAIARAIIKNAPILVFDEATSALDSESEKLIQDALAKLMKGRTTIVIAHRLSTIQKMDRIIVVENGSIIEQGNHKELLALNGTYAKLWAHQSGGFLED